MPDRKRKDCEKYNMNKHFEDTWNEAESLITTTDIDNNIEKIESILNEMKETKENSIIAEQLGEILFNISGITKGLNINIDAALRMVISIKKIDTYG
jgi:uncharacterized protein YabN with tetrapyrrole methylase and pyrophosphatase domain